MTTADFARGVTQPRAESSSEEGETGRPTPPTSGRGGAVVTVFGARGGIGKTTVAINLAAALAHTGKRVALVDLHLRFGDVAILMDIPVERSIADLALPEEEINPEMLQDCLYTHNTGVTILPAPVRADWRKVHAGHIERVVTLLAQTFDYVVLDTGWPFDHAMASALKLANTVLFVTTPDGATLEDTGRVLTMLCEWGFDSNKIRLVVDATNRTMPTQPHEIERALGHEVVAAVPYDPRVSTMTQLGSPLVVSHPDSRAAQSIVRLADAMVSPTPSAASSITESHLKSGRERSISGHSVGGGRLATLQEPFASNPFRALRLPAGISGDQIRQTIEQVRIEARLGSNPEVESRLDALTKAQAELLDPSKRVQHEVLWFYDPPGCLYDGNLEETDQALALYRAGSESREEIRSAHDSALWLLVEAAHSSDPGSAEDWTVRALSAWNAVARDPEYLRGLTGNERSRKHVAETVWGLGVDVLAISSRRCMSSGDLDGVLSRYRGAKSYGLEEGDLVKVAEPAIEVAVLEGQRKVAEARADSEAAASDPARARSWTEGLEDALSDQVDLSDEVSDLGTRELDKVLDEAAELIRGVAVSLHNDLSETQLASDLVEMGLELAVSRKTVEQLETDLGTLRGHLAIGPLADVIRDAVEAIQEGVDAGELFESGEVLYEAIVEHVDEEGGSASEVLGTALPVLRAVAIRLHNEFGETANAVTVMGWCSELAEDDEARAGYERDHRQLQYQMHLAGCFALVEAKRWQEAVGAARIAYSYADSADDRETASNAIASIANRRSSLNWRPIVGGVVGVIIVGSIIWGIIGGSNEGSDEPTSAPVSIPSDANPPSSGGGAGSSDPGNLADCLALEEEIAASQQELDSVEAQIGVIESAHPGLYFPPDVYDRYQGLINQYNALRIPHNSRVNEFIRDCA